VVLSSETLRVFWVRRKAHQLLSGWKAEIWSNRIARNRPVALMYNGINGAIGKARGTYDPFNSIAAGALTGAIFKSTGKLDPFQFGSVVYNFFSFFFCC